MKIIQYIPDFGLGGIQKAGCVLATRFAQLGHEVTVVGRSGGPRLASTRAGNPDHEILVGDELESLADLARDTNCDVLHIHDAAYRERLLRGLTDRMGSARPLIVSTPVFGRPPRDHASLSSTRTCCVGLYTFYRLCRWLGHGAAGAIRSGIGYVPLTPFDPASCSVSANSDPRILASKRRELGIAPEAFVVGRVGRNAPEKWHPGHTKLIDTVLGRCERATWLSVGFPEIRGRPQLEARWGKRFRNIQETGDFETIGHVFSCMDVQAFLSCNGECFAASIAEAAGLGVPTVALVNPLKDNGQAEQVIRGITGELAAGAEEASREVLALEREPDRLAALKRSCEAYARERWSSERVADDLLELYSFWRGQEPEPPYIRFMVGEHEGFERRYRKQMLSLAARNSLDRLVWRVLLFSAENWTLFRLGRWFKRRLAP